MPEIFVRTLRGLEPFAAAELEQRCGAAVTAMSHRLVVAEVNDPRALVHVGSIDDAFVLIQRLDGIGRHRSALDAFSKVEVTVAKGVTEVVASFVGKRNYNRYEIEDAIGASLTDYRSRRTGPVPHADTSLRVVIEDETAWIGRRIARRPLHRRAYKVQTPPGSLHPPLAFAMCMLAGLHPQQSVVDPCCGAGTIPAEALRFGARAVGIELDPAIVAMAHVNAPDAVILRADGGALPIAAADRVVTNPPWGRAVDPKGRLHQLPAEIRRVLSGGGRAVVLTEEPMDGAYPAFEHRVSVSGRWVDVTVWGEAPLDNTAPYAAALRRYLLEKPLT